MQVSARNRNSDSAHTCSAYVDSAGIISARNACLGLTGDILLLGKVKGKAVKFLVVNGASVHERDYRAATERADLFSAVSSAAVVDSRTIAKSGATAVAETLEPLRPISS